MSVTITTSLMEVLRPLTGKRIAVVGNAPRILTELRGAEIDNHDVVIRMNRGVPGYIPEATTDAIGSRCDVLALARSDPFDEIFKTVRPAQVWWMKWSQLGDKQYNDLPGRLNLLVAKLHVRGYTTCVWRYALELEIEAEARLGAKGSTGYRCADLCVRAQAKEVSLFGFDWWKGVEPGQPGNWYFQAQNSKQGGFNPHSGSAEKAALVATGFRDEGGVWVWR